MLVPVAGEEEEEDPLPPTHEARHKHSDTSTLAHAGRVRFLRTVLTCWHVGTERLPARKPIRGLG